MTNCLVNVLHIQSNKEMNKYMLNFESICFFFVFSSFFFLLVTIQYIKYNANNWGWNLNHREKCEKKNNIYDFELRLLIEKKYDIDVGKLWQIETKLLIGTKKERKKKKKSRKQCSRWPSTGTCWKTDIHCPLAMS